MAKSSKDELRRLELEEQIAEATKRSTANLESFAEAQKKIRENYKIIQKINLQIQAAEEDIVELKKQGLDETSDEIVAIKKRQAALRQDIELIRTVNKELSKGKNFAKAIGSEFVGWGKQLAGSILPSLSGIFSKYMEIDKLAHQTANTLGFQGSKLDLMRNNLAVTSEAYVEMGFSIEDAYKSQMALSEATGRQVMLSKGASIAIAETSRITGMAVEDMAGLTGQMEAFGLGAEQSADFILQMSQEASQMGLNSGKVIKKFEQNLGLLNKLNFKNGIAGLKAMTKFSEKFKLDMNAVASVADKVFRPEGAIEASAQLQVLGGDLAALGDPFQLMYKARNAPEELAKSLTKAAQASAVFNEKSGEFEINAYELDRLREAATALGMDYQVLVETAKQGAKIKKFEGLLGGKGLSDEEMEALTGAAQMGKNGASVTITDPDGKAREVLLKDLNKDQAKMFLNDVQERKELADKAMAMQDRFEAIKNKIMLKFIEIFQQNEPMIKKLFEALKWLADKLISFIDWSVKIFGAKGTLLMGLALYFGGKAALQWGLTAAVSFGKNLLSWALKGGKALLSKMTGGGGQSSVSSGAKGFLKEQAAGAKAGQSKQMDDLGKSSSKLGGIASVSAPQILALGAALLMVGGAIYLAATGLATLVQSFNGLSGPQILGAVAAIIALGTAFYFMIPAVATAAATAGLAAEPLLALGAAMLMIGGAIAIAALGVSVLVDSFTNMFAVIGQNGAGLYLAGLGFLALAAGIGVLTLSLIGLGLASFLALPGLLILGGATAMLTETASAIASSGGGEGISKTINAINSVDTDKLDALKSLSMWMALLGGSTTIKFDESLKIDGNIEISGEAGGKSNTDWVKDPVFIKKLKDRLDESNTTEKQGNR